MEEDGLATRDRIGLTAEVHSHKALGHPSGRGDAAQVSAIKAAAGKGWRVK